MVWDEFVRLAPRLDSLAGKIKNLAAFALYIQDLGCFDAPQN
jgi:hypothetical protein